jgi:hypothetical protein
LDSEKIVLWARGAEVLVDCNREDWHVDVFVCLFK